VKDLLRRRSILVTLGSGGVGKTTIAAALGVAAAAARRNTAVVTVDPARRLRDALGLRHLEANRPLRVDARRLRSAGLDPALKLSAMVPDVHGEWDAMVSRHVPKPALRRRILENAFYLDLRNRFAGSDAYAALEALYELHSAEQFDIEVVDTPPASHAFEFLQAPARLARLLDSRTARWFFRPDLSSAPLAMRIVGRAARYAARELEHFVGANSLSSMAEFFSVAADATGGIALRMRRIESLLRSSAVRFVLVTTAETSRLREARELMAEMQAERLHLGAIVINRFLDEAIFRGGADAADGVLGEISGLRASLAADGLRDDAASAAVSYLEKYSERAHDLLQRVTRFADELPARPPIALVPEIRPGTLALVALGRIAHFLAAEPVLPVGRESDASLSDQKSRASAGSHRRSDRPVAGVSL